MSFIRRKIDVTFQLGTGGVFGETGYNTVKVSGLKVQAHIDNVLGPGSGMAQIRIYGLTKDLMNQLSALNKASMAIRNNTVILEAGDDEAGMSAVFQGTIMVGQQTLNTAPDVSLLVIAQSAGVGTVQVVQPLSYPGSASVDTIMSQIATNMGLQFENSGVTVQLSTPYFPGSPIEQAQRCAASGNFDYCIDRGTLAIFPKGSSRSTTVPLISPQTGMIGYPDYSTAVWGVEVATIFNPALSIGGKVKIESSLLVANGEWLCFGIQHVLESETPGGQWMTKFRAASSFNDAQGATA